MLPTNVMAELFHDFDEHEQQTADHEGFLATLSEEGRDEAKRRMRGVAGD